MGKQYYLLGSLIFYVFKMFLSSFILSIRIYLNSINFKILIIDNDKNDWVTKWMNEWMNEWKGNEMSEQKWMNRKGSKSGRRPNSLMLIQLIQVIQMVETRKLIQWEWIHRQVKTFILKIVIQSCKLFNKLKYHLLISYSKWMKPQNSVLNSGLANG